MEELNIVDWLKQKAEETNDSIERWKGFAKYDYSGNEPYISYMYGKMDGIVECLKQLGNDVSYRVGMFGRIESIEFTGKVTIRIK